MAGANTIHRAHRAANLTDPTSATTFKDYGDSTLAACVYFPVYPSTSVGTKSFRFRAAGRALTAGSYNVTPKVSFGVSATAASNTVIAAATARACATTTAAWLIEGVLIWNATSSVMKGQFWALNGSTAVLDSPAVTTSVTADLTAVGKGLSVELTIGTGGTGYLDELILEEI